MECALGVTPSRLRFLRNLCGPCCVVVVAVWTLTFSPALLAQETVVTLDPASARIEFTLGATFHTVHGNFKLKHGEIRFDPLTGEASGSVVVDATSGDTDNSSRDKKMHAEVLESGKFPEIVFTPNTVTGQRQEIVKGRAEAHADVAGVFRLHGQDHEGTLAVVVDRGGNGELRVTAEFVAPYVKWGLKDPSSTFLHVKDSVDVEVHATAHIEPAGGPPH